MSHLNELLGLPSDKSAKENVRVLLLKDLEQPRALLVDDIVKPEEIVIKPLGAPLQNMPELIGAAFLGDGQIAPVLDLFYLLNRKVQSPKSKVQSQQETQKFSLENKSKIQNPKSKIRGLLGCSPSVRL